MSSSTINNNTNSHQIKQKSTKFHITTVRTCKFNNNNMVSFNFTCINLVSKWVHEIHPLKFTKAQFHKIITYWIKLKKWLRLKLWMYIIPLTSIEHNLSLSFTFAPQISTIFKLSKLLFSQNPFLLFSSSFSLPLKILWKWVCKT